MRGRGDGRGRGGRGRGGNPDDPIPAENIYGRGPQSFYAGENDARVRQQIEEDDPDLIRRMREECESDDCSYEAMDEFYDRVNDILFNEYEAAPPEVRQRFEAMALDARHELWRDYRERGRLLENEESLAQKAKDDALGIRGPIQSRGRGRGGRGGGGGVAASNQQQGSFVNGVLMMSSAKQEITPPFDKNSLQVKVGKIESEEYF